MFSDNSSFEDASIPEDSKSDDFALDEKRVPEEKSSSHSADSRDFLNEISGQEKFEMLSGEQADSISD